METSETYCQESKEVWSYGKASSPQVHSQSTYLHVWSSSSKDKCHEARLLDEKNGNTKWQDAEKCELDQLNEYGTFEYKGKGEKPPD